MTAPPRLAAFGLAAVVALGGGAALGAAAGPATTPTTRRPTTLLSRGTARLGMGPRSGCRR